MRPQDRLGAAHVRVSRNYCAGIFIGQIEQRRHQRAQQLADTIALLAKPQSRIERNLLIAAAASVDLVGDRAGALFQLADDQRVDVFIGGAIEKRGAGRVVTDFVERCNDGCALVSRKDTNALQRPRESLRAANIGVEQAPVEMERSRESLEDVRRPVGEASAPQLHLDFPWRAARTLIGRPIRLMKPRASF